MKTMILGILSTLISFTAATASAQTAPATLTQSADAEHFNNAFALIKSLYVDNYNQPISFWDKVKGKKELREYGLRDSIRYTTVDEKSLNYEFFKDDLSPLMSIKSVSPFYHSCDIYSWIYRDEAPGASWRAEVGEIGGHALKFMRSSLPTIEPIWNNYIFLRDPKLTYPLANGDTAVATEVFDSQIFESQLIPGGSAVQRAREAAARGDVKGAESALRRMFSTYTVLYRSANTGLIVGFDFLVLRPPLTPPQVVRAMKDDKSNAKTGVYTKLPLLYSRCMTP